MQREFSAKSGKKGLDLIVDASRPKSQQVFDSTENLGKSIKVDISFKTILLVLATIAAIYLGSKLFQVIIISFFAFILSSAALPMVKALMLRKVPKGLSIALVYLFFTVVIGITLTLIFVPFITESQSLISNLPNYVNSFILKLSDFSIAGFRFDTRLLDDYLKMFVNWLSGFLISGSGTDGFKTAVNTLVGVAGGLVSLLTMLIMSIYMVVDHDNFVDLILLRIIDEEKRVRVRQLVYDVEEKLGNWLIGQLTLCFIIGLLNWVLLTLARVPFALPLAVLAGLLESIPSLGPTISAIPAVLFAFIAGGPVTGLVVLVGCIIIQQLENTLIVPRVMSNAVGIRPIVVVLAVSSGFTLVGPIGALLSVPIAVLLEIFYQFYLDLQKLKAKGIV